MWSVFIVAQTSFVNALGIDKLITSFSKKIKNAIFQNLLEIKKIKYYMLVTCNHFLLSDSHLNFFYDT